MALVRSARVCNFGAIRFLSNGIPSNLPQGTEYISIPGLRSTADYSQFVLKELHRHIATPYILLVQWDGFVVDPAAWDNEFLKWDYIGAVWPQFSTHQVGNGGFSLRSRQLLHATASPRIQASDIEDTCICRDNRELLEAHFGIRFAPPELAQKFSYEATRTQKTTFGFHGLFNLESHMAAAEYQALWNVLARSRQSIAATLQRTISWLRYTGRWQEAEHLMHRLTWLELQGR